MSVTSLPHSYRKLPRWLLLRCSGATLEGQKPGLIARVQSWVRSKLSFVIKVR